MGALDSQESCPEERLGALELKLRVLDAARAAVAREIESLRGSLAHSEGLEGREQQELLPVGVPCRPEEKADLFLALFGARKDVFARFWENPRTGRKGYSPACANDRAPKLCEKPRVKCAACPNQAFLPLNRQQMLEHLRGRQTIGVYAIRADDTCIFLAADFDGTQWREDVVAYTATAEDCGIGVAVERSRSGDGAHAWIFFAEPVPARLARRLGTILMARTAARRPDLSLRSYDRFFPNQDVLPPGGFGNLIALPLQRQRRELGNTVFLDRALKPISDQWAFLVAVRRMSLAELRAVLERLDPAQPGPNADVSAIEGAIASDDRALDAIPRAVRKGSFAEEVRVTMARQVEIPTLGMPAALKAALRRLAVLPNPLFYERQRLRFSTHDVPRFISCCELRDDRLCLPRGVWESARDLLGRAGARIVVEDRREEGIPIAARFLGELTQLQKNAVAALLGHDAGVLVAPPGAGKTVMGCSLIARRGVRALILAHREAILDQWIERLQQFLGVPKRDIWRAPGIRGRGTRPLGVAMLQKIARAEVPGAYLSGFGLVIVDECHHVPAASFEAAIKHVGARYVIGLTATPRRKDGLERILFMQCGPVRHQIGSGGEGVPRKVVVHSFSKHEVDWPAEEAGDIHRLWGVLLENAGRTRRIAADVVGCIDERRYCVVLSDRKEHLRLLAEEVARQRPGLGDDTIIVDGSVPRGARQGIVADLRQRCDAGRPFALLATAALLGEGFDLPRLDTLFLTMPISFKGRVVQYAGRLHRDCSGKTDVRVFDYVEEGSPVSQAMYRRRLGAYREMGYSIETTAQNELRLRTV